jgi:D-alanyl-D-alanine carboxypeptidase
VNPEQDRRALESTLDRVLAQAADDPAVPGVIAAIHWPRRGFWWSSAAVAGARQGEGERLDAGCSFRIASITKLFVSAAMMRLVESACADLSSPLTRCLGEASLAVLEAHGYDPRSITLDMLMTHTSGLPDHVHATDYGERVVAAPGRRWTPAEQLELAVRAGPPLAEPGACFSYSDTGYVLLGEAIERITGQSIAVAVRRLVDFRGLGLAHTHWEELEPGPDLPSPRARQFLGQVDATGFHPSFDLHGGGGLVSTVDDLARFAMALVHGRVFTQSATLAAGLVVPAARREPGAHMHSRLAMVLPLGSRLAWGHTGFWGSIAACCPDLGLGVAASINQSNPQRAGLLLSLAGQLVAETEMHFGRC